MSVQGVDFPRLTLCDALDLAILIEQEAEERYEELADQMDQHHTPEAAQFFRFMATNEAKHGAQLAARRRQLFGDAERSVTRARLWDVEAPDYDQARAFMSVRQAMQTALESEEKAFSFFRQSLPLVTDPETRALFTELQGEEVEHQNLVKSEMAKISGEAELSGDAFEDEPHAQ